MMNSEISYEKTVEKYERMERIRKIKKVSVITLFAVLLVSIVFYAISIERKITDLANAQMVAIYEVGNTTVSVDETTTYYGVNATKVADDINNEAEKLTAQADSVEITTEYNLTTFSSTVSSEAQSTSNGDITVSDAARETSVSNTTESEITVSSAHNSGDKLNKIYYITKTGKKYHTADCSYLKSKIEITYEDILMGGYEPCSRCIR